MLKRPPYLYYTWKCEIIEERKRNHKLVSRCLTCWAPVAAHLFTPSLPFGRSNIAFESMSIRKFHKTMFNECHFFGLCTRPTCNMIFRSNSPKILRTEIDCSIFCDFFLSTRSNNHSNAIDDEENRHKRGVVELYSMVKCSTGCDPLIYKGYGCYCGFLGRGRTLDGIDRYDDRMQDTSVANSDD